MSFRRLAPPERQPKNFAFTSENEARIAREIEKYPPGRQASAVIAALWIGQEQEGWITQPMVEVVAKKLDMPLIRVLEVATFYTMFNLEPVGEHLVQICTTTPCWLRGSDDVVAACKKLISPTPQTVSADGKFSWMEVECLGACVNAPMLQIGKDFYEDLDGPATERIIEAFRRGDTPKPGPQNERRSSEPIGGATTLTDRSIYEVHRAGRAANDASAKDSGTAEAPQPKSPGASG